MATEMGPMVPEASIRSPSSSALMYWQEVMLAPIFALLNAQDSSYGGNEHTQNYEKCM